MHYTYVLLAEVDGRFYIGATKDLKRRVAQHEAGLVESTAYRRPLKLVYYEACLSPEDAYRRERISSREAEGGICGSAWLLRLPALGASSWNGTRRAPPGRTLSRCGCRPV